MRRRVSANAQGCRSLSRSFAYRVPAGRLLHRSLETDVRNKACHYPYMLVIEYVIIGICVLQNILLFVYVYYGIRSVWYMFVLMNIIICICLLNNMLLLVYVCYAICLVYMCYN